MLGSRELFTIPVYRHMQPEETTPDPLSGAHACGVKNPDSNNSEGGINARAPLQTSRQAFAIRIPES
jgi:hypothetical protein